MKLTPKQRLVLVSVSDNLGSLRGNALHSIEKGIASRLQEKGLLVWIPPEDFKLRKNLDNWTLNITEAGRAILSVPKRAKN